jgi:hypothetical protein
VHVIWSRYVCPRLTAPKICSLLPRFLPFLAAPKERLE